MPRQRDPNKGMVVAREACVIVVGAQAPTYEPMEVTHNRTGERVKMSSDRLVDPGKSGTSYVFKPYQRVPKSHPAVKDSPSSFMEMDDLDDAELEMVTT